MQKQAINKAAELMIVNNRDYMLISGEIFKGILGRR